MLNNISKFLSSRQLTIALLSLGLTIAVVSEQTKPVISKQTQTATTSAALSDDFPILTNRLRNSSDNSLLSRLRATPEARSQQQNFAFDSGILKAKSSNLLPKDYQKSSKKTGVISTSKIPTKDGVYLYGQSPTADQIGQGYIVFEKRQGKVTGAMYMPRSEFSCFQGTIDKSGELAMTVNGSQTETGITDVAATSRIPSISDDQLNNYSYSIALRDYHPIQSVSANDRRILQMCQGIVTRN